MTIHDSDNTLSLTFHSLNLLMEITIGDLAFSDNGGLVVVGCAALQTNTPIRYVIAANRLHAPLFVFTFFRALFPYAFDG